jgi:Cu2+-exporting ATPase
MKTSAIEVHDMLSVFSVDEVEKRIGDVPGVASVTVNFAAGNATVRYDETQLEAIGIKSAVRQRGFEPAAPAAGSAAQGSEGHPEEVPPPATAAPAAPAASPVATATDGSAAPDPSAAPPTPASSSAEPDAEPAASAGDGKHDKAATDKG